MTPHGESTTILKLGMGSEFRLSVPFAKARSSAQFGTLPTSLSSTRLNLSQPLVDSANKEILRIAGITYK
jgi:hypothetical protein